MKAGDYCVAIIKDKNVFCQVNAVNKNVTKLEVVETGEQHRVEISSCIIASLGSKPKAGSVFGVSTNYPRRVIATSLGQARIMFNLRKEDWKIIKFGINQVKKNFGNYLDTDFNIDILRDGSKASGTFTKNKLVIKLPVIEKGSVISAFSQAVSSAVWKYMEKPSLLRWYKVFKSYNNIISIEPDTLERMCDHVLRVGVKDYKKECDETDMVLFKECLSHINRTHRLDATAVTSLINSSGNEDLIREIWPTHADLRSSKHPFGDLSARNPRALYVEAVVAFILGSNMNPKIAKLIKNTSIVTWPSKDNDEEREVA